VAATSLLALSVSLSRTGPSATTSKNKMQELIAQRKNKVLNFKNWILCFVEMWICKFKLIVIINPITENYFKSMLEQKWKMTTQLLEESVDFRIMTSEDFRTELVQII
jgi:hypothetical protein